MSDKVYSFSKVRKSYTNVGIYMLAAGVISLVIFAVFIVLGIVKNGDVHRLFYVIPCVAMIVSIYGTVITKYKIKNTAISGKYLVLSHRICLVGTILYCTCMLAGVLQIIL